MTVGGPGTAATQEARWRRASRSSQRPRPRQPPFLASFSHPMSDADYVQDLPQAERIALASKFVLQAPPGEIGEVLNGASLPGLPA